MQSVQQENGTAASQEKAAVFESEAMGHSKDLYRAAIRMLQDPDRAADAVEQTYLIAWKSFHKYQLGSNCRAWLFQILFNVVRHERRTWFKWITGAEMDVASTELVASVPVPDTLTDTDILKALDEIPSQFREVLLLVDVEEFSYKEASEILHIPCGTVMSRLNRGRTLLRASLAETAQLYGIIPASRSAQATA